MSVVIPIVATESQVLTVQLGDQPCRIAIYQKSTGLYLDLFVNDVAIVTGRLCENNTLCVRAAYLGFAGDLIFNDTNGDSDPTYDGLGSRFVLLWIEP